MIPGNLENIQEGYEVVPVVLDRLCHRLAYRLEGSEMDDSIYLMFIKKFIHR